MGSYYTGISFSINTEKFNGSTWSNSTNYPAGSQGIGSSVSSSSDGVFYAHYAGTNLKTTYTWNGSVFTIRGNLSIARRYNGTGAGSGSGSALCSGGHGTSAPISNCEEFY